MLNKIIICCKQGHDVNYQEAQVRGMNLMNRRRKGMQVVRCKLGGVVDAMLVKELIVNEHTQ
jgi:hypothetical protein